MIYLVCSQKIVNKFIITSENIGLQVEKCDQIKLYYYVKKYTLRDNYIMMCAFIFGNIIAERKDCHGYKL